MNGPHEKYNRIMSGLASKIRNEEREWKTRAGNNFVARAGKRTYDLNENDKKGAAHKRL